MTKVFTALRGRMVAMLAVLAIVLPVISMACENLIPGLQKGVDTAKQISDQSKQVENDIQKQIDTLPVGDPVRVSLEAKLTKVKDVQAQADKYISAAQGTITSLQTGVISPELATTLGTVPYGNYILGGLGLALAIYTRAKSGGLTTDLANLTEAYKTVGPELSDADKAKAAAIVGPTLAAVLHPEQEVGADKPAVPVVTATPVSA